MSSGLEEPRYLQPGIAIQKITLKVEHDGGTLSRLGEATNSILSRRVRAPELGACFKYRSILIYSIEI